MSRRFAGFLALCFIASASSLSAQNPSKKNAEAPSNPFLIRCTRLGPALQWEFKGKTVPLPENYELNWLPLFEQSEKSEKPMVSDWPPSNCLVTPSAPSKYPPQPHLTDPYEWYLYPYQTPPPTPDTQRQECDVFRLAAGKAVWRCPAPKAGLTRTKLTPATPAPR